MDKITISTFQLFEMFPDQESARKYLESKLWPHGVTTNSIDSVWATLKRGIYGVYHHASPKHLGRYVNEFTFRLNDGSCKRHSLKRLESFVIATAHKRLTYAGLINPQGS